MNFKNYCIIGLASKKSLIEDIERMAEFEPNIFNPEKGVLLIATFTSAQNPKELTDFFSNNNRNFFLFELTEDTCGIHIENEDIYRGLFGFLKKLDLDELNSRAKDMIENIQYEDMPSSATTANRGSKVRKAKPRLKLTDEQIATMTSEEKNDLMNEIIGKGAHNLTTVDKALLIRLSK